MVSSEHLDVGQGHRLYVESVGTPGALPAVFLHGGPGSGCQPDHRSLFDPNRFHAVLFDQRGSGRSVSESRFEANTTDHLIADMEAIRRHLGFEKWIVVGGSWGSTLALAYAQRHPDRVLGLVLRAIFLGTRAELDWAFGTALATFYPALHQDFLSSLPEKDRPEPLPAYWNRILFGEPARRARYIRVWHHVERTLSLHAPKSDRLTPGIFDECSGPLPSTPAMEAHYFRHGCFLDDRPILDNMHRLSGLPGQIVQGRYDLLCPPGNAHRLASHWKDAEVWVVEGAGHSMAESPMKDAVKDAIDRMWSFVAD